MVCISNNILNTHRHTNTKLLLLLKSQLWLYLLTYLQLSNMKKILFLLFAVLSITSCKTYIYQPYQSPQPEFAFTKPLKIVIDEDEIAKSYTTNILYIQSNSTGNLVTNERKEEVK